MLDTHSALALLEESLLQLDRVLEVAGDRSLKAVHCLFAVNEKRHREREPKSQHSLLQQRSVHKSHPP